MDKNYESKIKIMRISSASALLSKIVPILDESQPELLKYVMTARFCNHILVDFVSYKAISLL